VRGDRRWLGQRLRHVVDRGGSELQTEALCVAALAIVDGLCERLEAWQLADGSWPAMPGVDEGVTLATALAAITLMELIGDRRRIVRAVNWLVEERCREAHWIWRWKLRAVDNKARFDPGKYGWGWVPNTVSWVIPTSFAIIALEQARHLPAWTRPDCGIAWPSVGRCCLIVRAQREGGMPAMGPSTGYH